jgi:hypothetical protein
MDGNFVWQGVGIRTSSAVKVTPVKFLFFFFWQLFIEKIGEEMNVG